MKCDAATIYDKYLQIVFCEMHPGASVEFLPANMEEFLSDLWGCVLFYLFYLWLRK